jgi:hypothetical protein
MSSLTVVVTGDDQSDDAIRRLAAHWTANGLMQDSVWLAAKNAAGLESGLPDISARLLTEEGEGELRDLFEIIAVRRLALVRVVLLQRLPYDQTPDPTLLTTGRLVADLVAGVLPRDPAGPGAGTALRRVNLLVPQTRTGPVNQELIVSGWEVNAVVSPEDRPDVQQASILVRAGVNYHAHALAAVACAGGLWRGVSQGAFDDFELDSSRGERDLVVFRSWARFLLDDVLTQRIADEAMALVQDTAGSGATPYVSWAAVAEAPGAVVARAHEELLGRGEWARDGFEQLSPPPKPQRGVKAAVGDLAAFQWRLARAARRVVTNTATRWMEDRLTRLTAGDQGAYVVRVDPQIPDDVLTLAQQRLEAQAAGLRSDMLKREAGKMQPPAPETWDELRRLCFGLVDASPLPAGFSTPERANVRETLPPRWVAPRPAEVVPSRAAAAHHRTTPGDGGNVTDENDLDEADMPHSLLGRLTATLTQRESQANVRAAETLERASDESPPEVSHVRRARRRLLMSWLAVVLMTVGAGVWAMVSYEVTDSLTLTGFLRGLGILLLIDVVVALLGGWQYYRALSRFEQELQTRLVERRHAAEVFVAAAREARRLRMLQQGVKDWTDVIGWVIHRPWATEEVVTEGVAVHADTLPASVAVAAPAPEESAIPRALIREAVAALCRRGWVRQLFGELMASMPDADAGAGERGYLAADLDSGLTSDGPRTRLAQAVASDALRAALARVARRRVAAAVADGSLRLPSRQVVRLGRYACPEPLSDEAFFARAEEAATPFVGELWAAEGMNSGRHLAVSSPLWMPPGRQRRSHADVRESTGDASMRVDISGTCQPADLALFAANQRVVEAKVHKIGAGWV